MSVPKDAFAKDERVIFTPAKGKPREATFRFAHGPALADIELDGDPFPVTVNRNQLKPCNPNGNDVRSSRKVRKDRTDKKGTTNPMPKTETKTSVKALRADAAKLGVEGWESMGRKDLAKAVAKASKNGKTPKADPEATTTKAKATKKTAKPKAETTKPKGKAKDKPAAAAKPAKKAAKAEGGAETSNGISLAKGSTPKSIPEDGSNPFRKNSNLHTVAALLLKGGKRSALAEKLKAKVALHPYQKDVETVDLSDYDKRLLLGATTMRDQYGYGIARTGRGIEGTIKVFIPGGEGDPRNASAKKGKAKASK